MTEIGFVPDATLREYRCPVCQTLDDGVEPIDHVEVQGESVPVGECQNCDAAIAILRGGSP